MKTLFKMIFVLVLALCIPALLVSQSKTGDRTKKSGSGNPQKSVANSDKKTSDTGDKMPQSPRRQPSLRTTSPKTHWRT